MKLTGTGALARCKAGASRTGSLLRWLILSALLAGAMWAAWFELPDRTVRDRDFAIGQANPLQRAEIRQKRLSSRHQARLAGIQLLGVLAVIGGGWLTWRTVRLTKEGQLTDRYAAAITHLGDDKPATQRGAIYALERIARDSPRDHWPIMELVVDYLPSVAPQASAARGDGDCWPNSQVVAVATVLTRRNARRDNGDLDLANLDLRNVRFTGANLSRGNLSGSDLSGAILERARLRRSMMRRTTLRGTRLTDARLRKADLRDADLVGANLEGADFTGADVDSATFYEASVRGVKGLPAWAIQQAAQAEPDDLNQTQSADTPDPEDHVVPNRTDQTEDG
jgi:hypothetical protein